MLVFQFPTPVSDRGKVIVVVILEKDNFHRLKHADPADILFSGYAKHISTDRPIGDLDLVIAYEEDKDAIHAFVKSGDVVGFVKWLERGREIKDGDVVPAYKMYPERLR